MRDLRRRFQLTDLISVSRMSSPPCLSIVLQLPPLETDRKWYMLSVEEQEKLAHELAKQMKTSWEMPKITKVSSDLLSAKNVY